MRLSIILLLIFNSFSAYAGESSDSSRTRLKISGNVSLNSNGMASIPSFSLGKPALIASLNLGWGRFSYDPVVAYGLNMRPWVIDNWVHYRIIYRPKFELRTGVNFSMFFSKFEAEEYTVLQGQQYLTFEIAGIYKFSPLSSFSLMYWSDNGQDPGTVDGHFINSVYERNDIEIGKKLLFSTNIQLFYIGYTGNEDGLFICPKTAFAIKKVPVSLFFVFTQAITSNIEPWPGFRWNVGAAYLF